MVFSPWQHIVRSPLYLAAISSRSYLSMPPWRRDVPRRLPTTRTLPLHLRYLNTRGVDIALIQDSGFNRMDGHAPTPTTSPCYLLHGLLPPPSRLARTATCITAARRRLAPRYWLPALHDRHPTRHAPPRHVVTYLPLPPPGTSATLHNTAALARPIL